MTQLLGGVTGADGEESEFPTWAIAHGHLSCAYPPPRAVGFPLIAPLYPLLAGGFAALGRIGHGVAFPSQAALGHTCSTAIAAMTRWSSNAGAVLPTIRIGYLSWLVLMAGVIALLRACGRGRCWWEPVTLTIVAFVAPVWMCVQEYFHPQDLVAMGLALCGIACARRGWWGWAGVFLGLAFTSQQFALLIAAPLVVVAPSDRRLRLVGSGVGAAMVVIAPLITVTSGQAARAVLIGSGNSPSVGGTLLWELHLHGPALVVVSRVLPIALAMALAWWALQRLGPAALDPIPLLSLIATSLCLRLVFEENLFGYYFMAITVMLIILDVVRGRIRGTLIAWIALVTLAFDPVPWGTDPLRASVPRYLWQLLLVPSSLALAAHPLLTFDRGHCESRPDARVQP
jgi:hypothetical protein